MKKSRYAFPFYRFRNWGQKKLNNLPKFTEPIIGKAIIQIQKVYQILSGASPSFTNTAN